ncbi:winged helix-turn-helix transcriptional regulator [Pseudomonas savastanoi]|uniref:winged helix-turn-helix transcriptional regulator n=1 Tax=Pseudomonas savastanoi TaxID=29438 RepID=UPI0009B4576B|nr:winged helix-turn-helix transcriptional regulator [Pseudomonas savastanoi]
MRVAIGPRRCEASSRTVSPTAPPRVDYELTKLGHSLKPQLEVLFCKGEHEQVRAKFDQQGSSATSAEDTLRT